MAYNSIKCLPFEMRFIKTIPIRIQQAGKRLLELISALLPHRNSANKAQNNCSLYSSQLDYKAPRGMDERPDVFHYYTRDSRRNIHPPIVIINPIDEATAGPALPLSVSSPVADKQSQSSLARSPSETSDFFARPPSYQFQRLKMAPSQDQPNSEGYFPINNFK